MNKKHNDMSNAAALLADVRAYRTRQRGGLADAHVKQRADAALAEIQRRAVPYLEAIAVDPCDPARYFDMSTSELELHVFLLEMVEDWHDLYQSAIREERWFVQHFLNARRRARLRRADRERD